MAAIYKQLTEKHSILLWDNLVGSGVSAIGHPLYQQTNPLMYLIMFIFSKNPLLAMRVYFFVYLLLAAYSFYWTTRYLKINQLAGLLGTILYLGSYQILIYTMTNGFRPDLVLASTFPLYFLLILIAVNERKAKYAIFAGFVFALSIHSGVAFYAPIAAIALATYYLFHITLSLLIQSNKQEELVSGLKALAVFAIQRKEFVEQDGYNLWRKNDIVLMLFFNIILFRSNNYVISAKSRKRC
jgi:hypothetical protein